MTIGFFRLEFRTDGAMLYPGRNPVVELTRTDRRLFREAQEVILLVNTREGRARLESPKGFRYLKKLHEELAIFPGVQRNGVRSVASLVEPPTVSSSGVLRTFLNQIPDGSVEFDSLANKIHSVSIADGLYLSSDGKAAAFYITLSTEKDRIEVVEDLESWVALRSGSEFKLRLMGPVVAEAFLGKTVLRDLMRLVPIMVMVIAILLLLCLRTLGGALVTMVEVVMVLIWTIGSMAYLGVPVTLVTTILPVILMAIAITDEIHFLERLRAHFTSSQDPASRSRTHLRNATESALLDVGQPVVLTSLTTAVAFLSFLTSSIRPIQHFGIFTSLGILFAMLFTFSLIPSLVMLLPVSWFSPRRNEKGRRFSSYVRSPTLWFVRHETVVSLLALLLFAASIPGLFRVSVQDSWISNFDPMSPLVSADRDFNHHFWGSYRFDVVLSSNPGFFNRPDGIGLLERLSLLAEKEPNVGGLLTYLHPYRMVADLLGNKNPISSHDGQTTARISAFVEMLVPRSDLRGLLTADGAVTRTRIFINNADFEKGNELRNYLQQIVPPLLADLPVRHHFSGDVPVALEVVQAVVTNQIRSIAWTVCGVAFLLIIVFRGLKHACLLILPIVMASLGLLAVMGYLGLPLGVASSMFAAMIVGIGVDFSIHFAANYKRERIGHDHDGAVAATLRSTGRAMRWNAIVLSIGFVVLTLSDLKPNRTLGLLLSAAILSCYISTLMLLPRLLKGRDDTHGGHM